MSNAATDLLCSAASAVREATGDDVGTALAVRLLELAAAADPAALVCDAGSPWNETVGHEALARAVALAESLLAPDEVASDPATLRVARAALRSAVVLAARQIDARRAAADEARLAEAASAAADHANYLTFLSHDLRGGLHGILLMIEVLKRDLAPPAFSPFPPVPYPVPPPTPPPHVAAQLEDLDVMRRGVLDTVSLMDRFIYAERFRRGLVKVRRDRVNLGSVGEQLQTQFAEPARERGLHLVVHAAGIVITDRALLNVIATNLLANAAQHASPGPLHLSLTALPEPAAPSLDLGDLQVPTPALPPAEHWRLEVSDPGPGLPPAVLASLESHPLPPRPASNARSGGVGLKLAKVSADALGACFQIRSSPTGTSIVVERG